MTTARLIGKTILGALFSLFVVLSTGSVVLLFIGSGDYAVWYLKPLLVGIQGLAAGIMGILFIQFIRGLVSWRSVWDTDEMGVIGLLVPLSLLLGVWVNITTGRGELGVFAVLMAVAVLLGVLLGIILALLPRLRRIVGRIQASLRRPDLPHTRKQPGH